MDKVTTEALVLLQQFVTDNRRRGQQGLEINWALIHAAQALLARIRRLEATGGTDHPKAEILGC